ncbi:MAG: type II toxin-antitoxin system HicA family toxin, partial [Clostridium sp.]|nr:type II toxin-antitoxin system HicA family toxin [Clostridium sp.]
KGKTSGSRVMFIRDGYGRILLHKPHPKKELKAYQIKQLVEMLEQEGLI